MLDVAMKEYSYTKKMLMRELGEDSRLSVTDLAKRIGCSRNTVVSNIKALEKELGLRYGIEFNRPMLGLAQTHVIRVRFGRKPSAKALRELFREDHMAQFVALTHGDFDMFISVTSTSAEEYMGWGVRTTTRLLDYMPEFFPSMVGLKHTGFTPVSNEMLRRLSGQRAEFDDLDTRILVLLNSDSRQGYKEMARKLGENMETVRYRVRRLSGRGAIRRFTAMARKPPTNYNTLFFVNFRFSPRLMERVAEAQRYYLSGEEGVRIVNRFQLLALTSGSDILFGFGCFENEEQAIRDVVLFHKEVYKDDNPVINFAMIDEVVKGELAARNIDIKKDFRPVSLLTEPAKEE